jgi:hypothetical protein
VEDKKNKIYYSIFTDDDSIFLTQPVLTNIYVYIYDYENKVLFFKYICER